MEYTPLALELGVWGEPTTEISGPGQISYLFYPMVPSPGYYLNGFPVKQDEWKYVGQNAIVTDGDIVYVYALEG